MKRRRLRRALLAAIALAAGLVLLAHPLAGASDVWGNVGPASPFGAAGLDGRYPLGNYALDEHFSAVSAGVFSGVDVSGVPPMIAYFLAEAIWQLTAWLASTLIDLFGFAFSLDLLNGSQGGGGALGPVAAAIHSIYANVFGGPWLVLGVGVAGCWAMWKALVQRRYAETAGQLALSLIYVCVALFFVAQPAQTIGAASRWTDAMSGAFLSIAKDGSPGSRQEAKQAGADQLFSLLVYQPWAVLEFGGVEHCVRSASASGDSEAVSVPVRPLPSAAARRLRSGEQVVSEGKTCVNDARKYGPHFLRFTPGSEERDAEYSALDKGDASKLPDADPAKAAGSYRLGPADEPASEAMEEGGQYQRLLIAVLVFVGELGAFCLLGALALGVILAQVLLLLWLAFSPIALVAAAIPGRGHDFFRGWLSRLAGLALRKAAYSLVLALLLAVCAALSAATSELGWLMSFGLQALLLWTVFLQRKTLTESLVGIATGPRTPGREGALRVLALYYGARSAAGATRGPRRAAGRAARVPGSALRGATRRLRGERAEPAAAAADGEPPRPRRFAAGVDVPVAPAPSPSAEAKSAPGRAGRGTASGARATRSAEEPAAARGRRADGDPSKPSAARLEAKSAPSPTGRVDEDQRQPDGSGPAPAPAPKRGRPAREVASPEDPGLRPTDRNRLEDELRADRERAERAKRSRGGEGRPGGDGAESGRAPGRQTGEEPRQQGREGER